MSEKNVKNILNLAGELSEALLSYFEKNDMTIIMRDEVTDYANLSYILVSNGEEAKQAAKDFLAEKNEIIVICLGQIKEVKDFLLYNGRLVIEPDFIESQLGEYILNKFFNQNYNIHLDESYSTLFSNPKEFKITNHLSTGLYVDEVCVSAFEKGFNIVALRSFMDHIIYYLTYLKQAGLAGVPYEVEYDNNENFFVVNIYCPVRNFVAEYMIDSFGPVNSKDPLQYLLGVVRRSSDFLEVTYVENPGRLVITGAWGRNEKKKINGLAFNNVLTTAQTIAQLDKKVQSYVDVEQEAVIQESKQENLKPQSLPGSILEMVVSQDENSILSKEPEKASSIVAFVVAKFEEEYPDRSINDIEEEEFAQIIDGYAQEDISELTEEDKEHLLERVQKNNITQAYDEEIQRVRENLEDEEDFKKELQDTLTEEVAKRVSGHMDADTLNRILGGKDAKESVQKIGGTKQEVDDFVAKISGGEKDKTKGVFTQHLGSTIAQKSSEFNVKISQAAPQDRKKQMQWFVQSSVTDAAKKAGLDFKVQSFLEQNASKKIELELESYANRIGRSIESLSTEDLEQFKDVELPKIVETVMEDEVSIDDFKSKLEQGFDRSAPTVFDQMEPEFESKFREKLEKRLAALDFVEKVDDKYIVTDSQVSENQMQEIIQVTMKETFNEEFKLEKANKEEIEKAEKEIVTNLSKTLGIEQTEVVEIVKGASQKAKEKEVQTVVNNIFKDKPGEQEKIVVADKVYGEEAPKDKTTNSSDDKKELKEQSNAHNKAMLEAKKASNLAEAELIKKLKLQEQENRKLQNQIKALELKVKSEKETDKKVQEVEEKVKAEAKAEIENAENNKNENEDKPIFNQVEAKQVSEVLQEGKSVSSDEAQKIQALIQKEQELLQKASAVESELKKVQIESNKKDTLFKSEIEKANRTIKGKEMVIEKAKESMATLAAKKDKEVKDLVKQVEELNKRLNSDESVTLKAQVKSLMTDNETILKTAELYKNKLDSFVNSKQANEKEDNSKVLMEENRQLKGLKNQMENKINSLTKENKSLDDRYNKIRENEAKFRTESTNLKAQVKDLDSKLKALKDNEARLVAIANKAQSQGAAAQNNKEVELLKTQNAQLQAKLTEVADKMKAAAGPGDSANGPQSAKEKHLEKTAKMLQAEISKARGDLDASKKEIMKMKGEATGLKNKITALEKEVEKYKKASEKGAPKKAA